MNQPWGSDQYSPLDFTTLDHHLGTIGEWRQLVDAVHSRNMYIILDNTYATYVDPRLHLDLKLTS